MRDTDAEAEAIVRDAVRRRVPMQRVYDALALSAELRSVALAAARRRHPDATILELVEWVTGEPLVPEVRHGPRRR
jgi:hypothetical protein